MLDGLKNKVRSIDLDDFLAYDTFKVVHVRDRRLGGLYWLFNIVILIYVIYTIITDQKYNIKEPPVPGSVRISLKAPDRPLLTSPYCRNAQGCVYLASDQIIFPQGSDRETFITTRISRKIYNPPDGCDTQLPTSTACTYTQGTSTDSGIYFVADIENYTLMIEHSIRGKQTDISTRSGQLKGQLLMSGAPDKNAIPYKAFENSTSLPNVDGDVMTVADIMYAAKLNLEDPSFAPGANKANGETQRSAGAVIVVVIDYRNRVSKPSELKYYYRPTLIDGAEYKTLEVKQNDNGTVTELNRHGIKIVFQQSGVIGRFDFLTMLTNLVASIALLKVASLIVEVLMLRFLPERNEYSQRKFEHTDDFDQIRKDRAKIAQTGVSPTSEV